MHAYTAILVRGALQLDLKAFSELIRMPVVAYAARDTANLGGGESETIDPADRDRVADVTYSLHELTGMQSQDEIEDPVVAVRERLPELRAGLARLEAAVASSEDADENEVVNAAEALRHDAEGLAFTLWAWDARDASQD